MEIIIDKYGEMLTTYIALVHEASEGRYGLTQYDLCVIEAALQQMYDNQTK